MATATLTFDTNNHDEASELAACLEARNLICALSEFDNLLRNAVKYGTFQGAQLTPEQIDIAEKLRTALTVDLDDRNLRKLIDP